MEDDHKNSALQPSISAPGPPADHGVSIGILTYKRPDGLARCLDSVSARLAEDLPAPWVLCEILVIDNDSAGSGRAAAESAADRPGWPGVPIRYVIEATPGIAAARSRALGETNSRVLVFIDDDEVADDEWPHALLSLMAETGAAMVGGPVLSEFTEQPPDWVVAGRFFERDNPAHGSPQEWLRSGNLAIDVDQVRSAGVDFDRRFPQGEDSAFTRRARAKGLDLRWSSRGSITEFVGGGRFDVMWRLKREYHGHRHGRGPPSISPTDQPVGCWPG